MSTIIKDDNTPLAPELKSYFSAEAKKAGKSENELFNLENKQIQTRKGLGTKIPQYDAIQTLSTSLIGQNAYLQRLSITYTTSPTSQQCKDKIEDNIQALEIFKENSVQFLAQKYKLSLQSPLKAPANLISAFLDQYTSMDAKQRVDALREIIKFLVTFGCVLSPEQAHELFLITSKHEKELATTTPLAHLYCLCDNTQAAITLITTYRIDCQACFAPKENHILYRKINFSMLPQQLVLQTLLSNDSVADHFGMNYLSGTPNLLPKALQSLSVDFKNDPFTWIETLNHINETSNNFCSQSNALKLRALIATQLLMRAVDTTDYALALYSINNGATVETLASDKTPLIFLAYQRQPECLLAPMPEGDIFSLLLAHGADISTVLTANAEHYVSNPDFRATINRLYLFAEKKQIGIKIAINSFLAETARFPNTLDIDDIINDLINLGADQKAYFQDLTQKKILRLVSLLKTSEVLRSRTTIASELLLKLLYASLIQKSHLPLISDLITCGADVSLALTHARMLMESAEGIKQWFLMTILLQNGAWLDRKEMRTAFIKKLLEAACTQPYFDLMHEVLSLEEAKELVARQEEPNFITIALSHQKFFNAFHLRQLGAPLSATNEDIFKKAVFLMAIKEDTKSDEEIEDCCKIIELLGKENPSLLCVINNQNQSLIDVAISNENIPVICTLLELTTSLSEKDINALKAYLFALVQEEDLDLEAIDALVEAGLSLNLLQNGSSIIDILMKDKNYLNAAQLFIKYPHIPMQNKAENLCQLLFFLCKNNAPWDQESCAYAIRTFIKQNVNLSATDSENKTFVDVAYEAQLYIFVFNLLQHGAPCKNLNHILDNIDLDSIYKLVEAGFPLDNLRINNSSIIDILIENKIYTKAIQLFIKYPNIPIQDKDERLCQFIFFLCQSKKLWNHETSEGIIKKFINQNVNLFATDRSNKTYVDIAHENKQYAFAFTLLLHGAPCNNLNQIIGNIFFDLMSQNQFSGNDGAEFLEKILKIYPSILTSKAGNEYFLEKLSVTLSLVNISSGENITTIFKSFSNLIINNKEIKDRTEVLTILLRIACWLNDPKFAKTLIAHGADVKTKDRENNYLLDTAHSKGYSGLTKLLLINKAPGNIASVAQEHLKTIIGMQDKELIRTALKGVNSKKDPEILRLAIDKGMLNVLLENGYSPNPTDNFSPLAYAIAKGDLQAAISLHAKGANIDDRKSLPLKQSVLHTACENKQTEIVKWLITFPNCPIRYSDMNGLTPLHIACQNNHQEIIELLLDRGASIYMIDDQGRTPFDLITDLSIKEQLSQKFEQAQNAEEEISLSKRTVTRCTLPPLSDEISLLEAKLKSLDSKKQLLLYKQNGGTGIPQLAIVVQKENRQMNKPSYVVDQTFTALADDLDNLSKQISQIFAPVDTSVSKETTSSLKEEEEEILVMEVPESPKTFQFSVPEKPKKPSGKELQAAKERQQLKENRQAQRKEQQQRNKSAKQPTATESDQNPQPAPKQRELCNIKEALEGVPQSEIKDKAVLQIKELNTMSFDEILTKYTCKALPYGVHEWRVDRNFRLIFILDNAENKIIVVGVYKHKHVEKYEYKSDIPAPYNGKDF